MTLGEGLSSEVGVISILFTLIGDGARTHGILDVTLPNSVVGLLDVVVLDLPVKCRMLKLVKISLM